MFLMVLAKLPFQKYLPFPSFFFQKKIDIFSFFFHFCNKILAYFPFDGKLLAFVSKELPVTTHEPYGNLVVTFICDFYNLYWQKKTFLQLVGCLNFSKSPHKTLPAAHDEVLFQKISYPPLVFF